VSGESEGAMGLHYVNQKVLSEGKVEATRPQIVIYEPTSSPNGAFVNWHPHVSCNSFVDPRPSP
jgi:hypothetical protein